VSVSGLQRLRKLQIGYQASFASNTSATKALPYRGAIEIDPQLTDPDVDVGSLDPILPPFAGAANFTSNWTGNLAYNDAPDLWASLLKGAVTPTGAVAKQHIFQAASLTQDTFPYATYQWGDDVVTDWIHGGGSIIDEFTAGFDEDLGAWTVDFNTIHARANFGGPTGGLTVDNNPTWVYGANTEVFIDASAGAIGTSRLDNAVHSAELHVTANNDPKRFAQGFAAGSNVNPFTLANFGRGAREIELVLGVAKTTATIAQRQSIDDAPPAEVFIELRSTSSVIITGTTPYSQSIRMPMRLITAEDAEFGENNTGYNLTYRARYNSTLGYAIRVVTVTTNSTTYP
jgi:hypothetical protein